MGPLAWQLGDMVLESGKWFWPVTGLGSGIF